MPSPLSADVDTAELRKARGAFFTPEAITRFISDWAIRSSDDTVLEPSTGDAAFLVSAVKRMRHLSGESALAPRVDGVEIHANSARVARSRVQEAGGIPNIAVSDFFRVEPQPRYSAVIGNPPYIRYQDFTGESRTRSREAALKVGVSLTALASSWAAFTVHSALFLQPGGRMGLVLPAELLSVNYAAAVRQFLFDKFQSIELVLFTEQVFPDAEADVVLLLADGFGEGPTDHAAIHQAKDASSLATMDLPLRWTPPDPAGKWTGLLVGADAIEPLHSLKEAGHFTHLETWGDTTLGMVTGNNKFFALSPARVAELRLTRKDLIRLSPPGSTHLRGLELSTSQMSSLGREGKATWLFRPSESLSPAAQAYVETGHRAGVDQAYKCRVRKPWYRVPLVPSADLLLTCMNADTPRLTTNSAAAHHLNSVHGVYLREPISELGRELLPLASLNSISLLNAEMVGRSYGGGILKLEPREADVWAMPSPRLIGDREDQLRGVKTKVGRLLEQGKLADAVHLVDEALLLSSGVISQGAVDTVREARKNMANRRVTRGRSGR
ncbi:Modification methylase Eco57IB [Arthrobacter sp. SO5]|uniref:HsdM family class I SAM-dependent methyltransferase n=1 Tax=Arthrobacter sp. SO5 TaxID=1897055 RepID=UPI001E36D044|nr:N-6 DNA methylase [Arthrobacter sp. SO5]MCB5273710.1 Modification methylase Eco57IB [Arthrobacter sp. SO5]